MSGAQVADESSHWDFWLFSKLNVTYFANTSLIITPTLWKSTETYMLYNLFYHAQNVNSLVRASSAESNLTIPILDYLLKTNCIEILCDTRMNDQKIRKIKNILCKSSQIGVEKERFFSTSQDNNKVGGVSIFLPQYLDSW